MAGSDYVPSALFHFSKGLADYRQEHFTEAVGWMQKVLAAARGSPELEASAQVVLAMAQFKLQRPDEAQVALNRALELEHTTLPQLGDGGLGPYWVTRLETRILLREANALLAGQPAPVPDQSKP